jgi:hypothetical protein
MTLEKSRQKKSEAFLNASLFFKKEFESSFHSLVNASSIDNKLSSP